ncbi:uncharacterized protein LOC134692741 [Mytilus trossulus]|uniref:uncharacterized protein LOC134692741 n=1 Tax=Mytilus trossulus TaxID=6551 RepID=UPI003003C1AB
MEQKHRNILQSNFAYLIKNLHNVEEICDHLVGDGILTSGMMDSIKHKKPRPTGQTRELLSILPRRGTKAYESFINALDETGNGEVASHLETNNSKSNGQNPGKTDNGLSKPKNGNGDTQEAKKEHSGKPEGTQKSESENKQDPEGWPNLKKRSVVVQKRDITKCTEDAFKEICEKRQVYNMTGKKKGKFLSIANLKGTTTDENTGAKSVNDSLTKNTLCENRCRSCVDFDKTAISQLFTHMKYESKAADMTRDVPGEEMKKFLDGHLNNKDGVASSFDSLVVVFFSGGYEYEPANIYDKNGNKIDKDEIFTMMKESKAFKGKPKIVIIRTYSFEEETCPHDVLDAANASLHYYTKEPNTDDLFVVSSQPRTEKGPWIIGDGMNGSYFIQALIHVFKNMAHEKSFMEMMEEVNICLTNAVVPDQGKKAVAEVMILEQSVQKDLFFFPGLLDVPPVAKKVDGWPDLAVSGNTVKKSDIKACSENFQKTIQNQRKIYPMTSTKRGKFILISNAQCNCTLDENQTEEDAKKKEQRYKECITNSDFDKSNMSQLFKYMGYDTAGGILTKKTKEDIKDFLKKKLNDIDNDPSLMYDSLVIMFLSGKFDSKAGKIYDCDGLIVPRSEILEIMNGCRYFKGKPKVCFVQTYNFLEESAPYDSTDSAVDTILRNGTPNTDDIFMVSSYPRTEQGPWIIGENMSGSYFIQALIYVFKKHAHDKSLIEILEEANKCLLNAVVPNKKAGTVEKIPVAQIVLLEYCAGKELFFFPGLEFKAQDLSASLSGKPVCSPSE